MYLYENILKRLLTELRDAPILGGKDVQQKAKRFDEAALRRIVRSVLREDFEGFKRKVGDVDYTMGQGWRGQGKEMAKHVKRSFAEEADHEFMKSLVKVHWTTSPAAAAALLRNASSKDEISTTAYLPGEPVAAERGYRAGLLHAIGIEVQGRVTLAASDMSVLYTGSWESTKPSMRKSSGVVRRPAFFTPSDWHIDHFILDRRSFFTAHAHGSGEVNEFVVDNWRPVSIRIGTPNSFLNADPSSQTVVAKLAEELGIPVLDENGRDLTDKLVSLDDA